MLMNAFGTVVICVLTLVLLLSLSSSRPAVRERKRQAAIEELDRRDAREAPASAATAASNARADRAIQAQQNLDADQAIADLQSSDRDVLNEAIQKIQGYRACQAVPKLMDLLRESSDDYIAGIAAQTVATCNDSSTYDTIVDQFLRRKATLSMIDAIGKVNTTDERVIEKIKKLVTEPNEDEDVPKFALRVKAQLEQALHKPL